MGKELSITNMHQEAQLMQIYRRAASEAASKRWSKQL